MRKASPSTELLGFVHPAAFLVLACVGAYWNSLGGPFVWNDQAWIVDNQTIRQLWPFADLLWPARGTPEAGHPIVNLSFALNYAVGGTDVIGYHLVNLVIHLLSALVLFGIVRRTLKHPRVRPSSLWAPDVLALGATLLWLVHPLQSEAVNYLSARGELLTGLFLFLTLYCAADARASIFPTHQVLWETASVVCCALGMASSPLMLTAPLVVLLYDRIFEFNSLREALRLRRLLYAALAATWLELGVLMWAAGRPAIALSPAIGWWSHLLNQVQMIAHYLWLTVWPRTLVLDYGPPRAMSPQQVWPAAILLLALLAATAFALRRSMRAGFLGATFLLTLAPGLGLALLQAEAGAERYMYVPLAALAVLAVGGVASLAEHLAVRFPRQSKSIVSLTIDVVFVVLLASAVRTVYRSEQYADAVALWSSTVAERPHGRARYALGTSLIAAGAEDEGIEELRRAAPDIPAAKYALGNELYATGQMAEAARVLRELIRDTPAGASQYPARLLLAQTLMAQGQLEESAAEFQTVLDAASSTPSNSPVNDAAQQGLSELGTAQRIIAADLLGRQRVDEAVAHGREAVRLRPTDAGAYATLGSALAAQGKPDEAIVQFREALRIDPGEQEAQSGLVSALNAPRSGRK
ncbi:MAG: tetratricopeptide repeat protein [Vicinamibacterales bacterium]